MSLMRLQFSRSLAIVSGQLLVNVFLASWLISEYAHNPFMQQYLSNFWTANTPMISIAIVLAGVIAGGSYLAFSRRQGSVDTSRNLSATDPVGSAGLAALDVCPVCNLPLKALSEDRFQCRKCRRYFKK